MTAMQQALANAGLSIRRIPTFKGGLLLNENPDGWRNFSREGERPPKRTPMPRAWKGDTGPTVANQPRRTPATRIGQRIRAYRNERDISQNVLAEASGLDHTTISRIESGARAPSPEALDAIATALALTERQTLYLFLDTYVPERLHRHLEV